MHCLTDERNEFDDNDGRIVRSNERQNKTIKLYKERYRTGAGIIDNQVVELGPDVAVLSEGLCRGLSMRSNRAVESSIRQWRTVAGARAIRCIYERGPSLSITRRAAPRAVPEAIGGGGGGSLVCNMARNFDAPDGLSPSANANNRYWVSS